MTAQEHRNICIKTRTQLSRDPGGRVRIFQNPTGQGYAGKATWQGRDVLVQKAGTVKYGLAPGSADLIGWASVEITPEMVGTRRAIFVAIEVKSGKARQQANQKRFLALVAAAGGISGEARSPEDAEQILIQAGADPALFNRRKK